MIVISSVEFVPLGFLCCSCKLSITSCLGLLCGMLLCLTYLFIMGANNPVALCLYLILVHFDLQAAQRRLGFLNKNLGQGWSLLTMIFLMVVVVVLVLVLFKLL